MRRASVPRCAVGLLTAVLAAGCAVSLEDAHHSTESTAPVLPGCGLTYDDGQPVYGRLTSVPGDPPLWLAGDDGNRVLRGLPGEDCAPLETVGTVALPGAGLAGVATADGVAWFYRGGGVALGPTFDAVTPSDEPLWTADRPPYGTAAVADDGFAWLYGCLPARFLDADCWVARAPLDDLANRGAYTYWTGSGRWQPDIDDAFPLLSAGTEVSVARAGDRFLMAYVTPLGNELTLRSSPGPAGPWSAPVVVGRCALPSDDAQAFCARVGLHPDAAPAGSVGITYGAGSFTPGAAAVQMRFVEVEVPSSLP